MSWFLNKVQLEKAQGEALESVAEVLGTGRARPAPSMRGLWVERDPQLRRRCRVVMDSIAASANTCNCQSCEGERRSTPEQASYSIN